MFCFYACLHFYFIGQSMWLVKLFRLFGAKLVSQLVVGGLNTSMLWKSRQNRKLVIIAVIYLKEKIKQKKKFTGKEVVECCCGLSKKRTHI